jgi:hypothetical protein
LLPHWPAVYHPCLNFNIFVMWSAINQFSTFDLSGKSILPSFLNYNIMVT